MGEEESAPREALSYKYAISELRYRLGQYMSYARAEG